MYTHRLILLFVFAAFLFSPMIIDWWLKPTEAWYRPFAIWLILIGISIFLNSFSLRQEHVQQSNTSEERSHK